MAPQEMYMCYNVGPYNSSFDIDGLKRKYSDPSTIDKVCRHVSLDSNSGSSADVVWLRALTI